MRYAVFLTFDNAAEVALQALREKLARDIPGVPKVTGKMVPHLSLAVFDDNDRENVLARFQTLAAQVHPFTLTLGTIGSFPGRKKVLFIAPQPSPELQNAFALCHAAFAEQSVMVPAYLDPAKTRPHVTLTKGIGGLTFQKAKSCAKKNWQPVTATTKTLGLIDVQKPLDVLASRAF